MGVLVFGGLEEIRTPDPHNANVVRSQLRYKPKDYYGGGFGMSRIKRSGSLPAPTGDFT